MCIFLHSIEPFKSNARMVISKTVKYVKTVRQRHLFIILKNRQIMDQFSLLNMFIVFDQFAQYLFFQIYLIK